MRTRSHREHEDVHSVQGRKLSVKYEQIQSVWKKCLLMVFTEEESRVSVSLIPGHVKKFVTEYFISVVFGQINNGFATPSPLWWRQMMCVTAALSNVSVMGSSWPLE